MGARVLACVLPDLLKVFQRAHANLVPPTDELPASAPPILAGSKFNPTSEPIAEGTGSMDDGDDADA